MHAFTTILAKEGFTSLFRGAMANILRAVAGAGALSGYDQLQIMLTGKSSGVSAG